MPTTQKKSLPKSLVPFLKHCLVAILLLAHAGSQAATAYSNPSVYGPNVIMGIQQDSVLPQMEQQISTYNTNNPIEKIYLHTDRELFSSGEIVWYSGYAVMGPQHQYSQASKVLHIDLIDPNNNILISQTHELVLGKTNGSIALPKSLLSGNYQLRAYTNGCAILITISFSPKN